MSGSGAAGPAAAGSGGGAGREAASAAGGAGRGSAGRDPAGDAGLEPCLRCGVPLPPRRMGCTGGHCPNCAHPYPHGDCSD